MFQSRESVFSYYHYEHDISTAAENFKPTIIKYYDSTKSEVNVLDKLTREYSCKRCTVGHWHYFYTIYSGSQNYSLGR